MRAIGLSFLLLNIGCQTRTTQPSINDNLVYEVVSAHNDQRKIAKVSPLVANSQLILAAQRHAEWMFNNKKVSHTGNNDSSFAARAKAEGYVMVTGGENIASGYRNVTDVMNGWLHSLGHKNNILNPDFKEIGVGFCGTCWCVVFAAPREGLGAATVSSEPDPLINP